MSNLRTYLLGVASVVHAIEVHPIIIIYLIINKTNEKLRQEVTKCDKEIDELKVKMQQMQKQHGKQIRDL